MKYTNEWLIDKLRKDNNIKYLFFWGHQPSKDLKISKTCFSQWFEVEFEKDGIIYLTAEHWMMAEKARLFKDDNILAKILKSNSTGEVKKLGRKIRNFDQNLWNEYKYQIVKNGNLLKFSQNKDLEEFLLKTKNSILVEASPYDTIWGIGMGVNDDNIEQPIQWKGENLLGYALMEVRDILIKTEQDDV